MPIRPNSLQATLRPAKTSPVNQEDCTPIRVVELLYCSLGYQVIDRTLIFASATADPTATEDLRTWEEAAEPMCLSTRNPTSMGIMGDQEAMG